VDQTTGDQGRDEAMTYTEFMRAVEPGELSTPKSGTFDVKVDCWWLVDNEGRLIFYSGSNWVSPMCNPDKRIADVIVKQYPEYTVKQIPLVFISHNCSDF
jgi:hypothetical protein